MARIASLCVYCGSSPGARPAYQQAAQELGTQLGERGIELIYGGGGIGLMGLVADAALTAGGRVTGVIPGHLDELEVGHDGVRMEVVPSMHARKQRMFELADAFVALPGGAGTLDESIEIITWRQLHLHDKPLAMIDIEGYWGPFQALMRHVVEQEFAGPAMSDLYFMVASVAALWPALEAAPEPRLTAEAHLL
ncbi:MAG: TIGR00730 family Rossman fold protein [Alphaproteobacteria bacterium]|jgi:hypothetical protein|nr:TIGR00730 family Rossman fold protein [Rhodospirillaceae bacterium]MDP6405603.1 TIGR00730 family Rossman fold protein [Alphaproteobacteria bacterium]MDP6623995.1 TIGR00730 family Rossman fold protein [Alphaproteobacteria bacterium]MDP7604840.1 TIGR00730 family Rossman fold protein [Alphaproteobacteria bacterium]HJP23648.1 TIGR00730 family Rossman fold protein [Alphaproteobacteria bacterium]|tara:strand:- start:1369 stop:1950 length:582 start_codon:yes stop_codon:yes gene_type:complete